MKTYLENYHIKKMDFIHAIVSLLMFALSDANVQNCYCPKAGPNMKALFKNFPLAAGVFSTFFFSVFPTTRRGIGYADFTRNGPSFDHEMPVLCPPAQSNANNK